MKVNRYLAVTLLVLMTLVVASTGCAHKAVAPSHPNQVDALDGHAFDVLVAAQAVLAETKAQVSAGSLPQTVTPVVNKAGEAYNVALGAWLAYRANPGTGDYDAKLNSALAAVAAAIGELQRVKGVQ